jgi:hypothetical protein
MTVTATRPDTHDMVIVHRVFRRECGLLPRLVRGVRPGDTGRAAVVGEHCADICTALHHHHAAEDELVWPKLLERATPDRDVVRRMQAQHDALAHILAEVEQVLPRWRANASVETGEQLAGLLAALSSGINEHLAAEEQHVLPIVEAHLTAEEWAEVGEHGAASIPKEKLLVFLGAILEDADRGERREWLKSLPLVARVLWPTVGRRKYARYVGDVRGFVPAQRSA